MNKRTLHSLGFLVAALGTAAYSCSSSDTGLGGGLGAAAAPSTGGSSSGGTGATPGGTAATGGSGLSTSSGGSGSGGPLVEVDASTTDGSTTVDEDAACGTGMASAALKEVNMFIMFDRSWSMTECGDGGGFGVMGDPRCTTGPSRWDLTSQALKQFVMDPAAADLRVALRFFPDDNPAVGCDGYQQQGFPGGGFGFGAGGMPGMGGIAGSPGTAGTTGNPADGPNCDIDACSMPLVDIAPLTADAAPIDTQEQKLLDAIDMSAPPDTALLDPNPLTPTSAALGGAAKWAANYQTAHPNEKTVIVLITDGEPQGCDTNIRNIAAIAADAYMTNGVATYVIGLSGSNEQTLDQIASAGGTERAYTVSDGDTATTDLLQALLAIRGMAISCELDVPKADSSGMAIDPKLINVNYTTGDSDMPTEFGLVPGAADCGTSLGWYYDDPSNPSKILLCPSACDTVTKDTNAKIQILAGCKPHIVTR